MALVNCTECGKQISDRANACPNCGAPGLGTSSLNKTVIYKPTKSRSTAVLLAIFLGGLGVHKFYLNRPGMGVLYMLFCWTFIPMIIGFIEGLCYLSMSDESFNQRYLTS